MRFSLFTLPPAAEREDLFSNARMSLKFLMDADLLGHNSICSSAWLDLQQSSSASNMGIFSPCVMDTDTLTGLLAVP